MSQLSEKLEKLANEIEAKYPKLKLPRTFDQYVERMRKNSAVPSNAYDYVQTKPIYMSNTFDEVNRPRFYQRSNFWQIRPRHYPWNVLDYMELVFYNTDNLIWTIGSNPIILVSSMGDYYNMETERLMSTGITEYVIKTGKYIEKSHVRMRDDRIHRETYSSPLPIYVIPDEINHMHCIRIFNWVGWLEISNYSHNRLAAIHQTDGGNNIKVECIDWNVSEDDTSRSITFNSIRDASLNIGILEQTLCSVLRKERFYYDHRSNKSYRYKDPNHRPREKQYLEHLCLKLCKRITSIKAENGTIHTFYNNNYYLFPKFDKSYEGMIVNVGPDKIEILSPFMNQGYTQYNLSTDSHDAFGLRFSRGSLIVYYDGKTNREDFNDYSQLQGDHWNKDTQDDSLPNLRWVTHSENCKLAKGFKHVGIKNSKDGELIAALADIEVLNNCLDGKYAYMLDYSNACLHEEEFHELYWSHIDRDTYEEYKMEENDIHLKIKYNSGISGTYQIDNFPEVTFKYIRQLSRDLNLDDRLSTCITRGKANKYAGVNQISESDWIIDLFYFKTQKDDNIIWRVSSYAPIVYIELHSIKLNLKCNSSASIPANRWHEENLKFEQKWQIKFGFPGVFKPFDVPCTCPKCANGSRACSSTDSCSSLST